MYFDTCLHNTDWKFCLKWQLTLQPEEEFYSAIQDHATSRGVLVLLTGKGARGVALKIAKDAVSTRKDLKVLIVWGYVVNGLLYLLSSIVN